MIIIRKPRRKGWKTRMCMYLEVAMHAFELSDMYSKEHDLDKMYDAALKGSKNLHRAADEGGFFNVEDLFKWIEQQNKRAKRS